MKKEKILYFNFSLPYLLKDEGIPAGGAATEFFSWSKGFISNDFHFGNLTWEGAENYIGKETDIDIVESYKRGKGIPKFRLFYYWIPRLFRAIKDYDPDIVIQACYDYSTGLIAILTKILKKKFVYRVENDDEADGGYVKRKTIIDIIFYKIGLRLADAIACQNNYQFKKIKELYPNKNVFQINVPFFSNSKEINTSKREYIAWVGIFQKQKNMLALLEIAKKSPNIKFKIAGSAQSGLDNNTKVALKGLEKCPNIEFVGFLNSSEVRSFLSNSAALLNTSHYEGFSLTFLEAWAVGTPVITTINVNPDNVIREFNLGVVANSYDEIPQTLNNLLSSTNYSSFSERCKMYVEKNHNPKILAQQFLEKIYS